MAKHLESKLQIECVKWFRLQFPKLLIFAIPNGGQRNAITASILKAEGVLAGVADLCIMKSNGKVFFIEMKSEKGKQSPTQFEFEKYCANNRYDYYVCKNFDVFKSIIKNECITIKTALNGNN